MTTVKTHSTLVDRQEDVHLLLSAVMEHKGKHRMGFTPRMLTATKNRQMEDYGAVDSEFWGRGKGRGVWSFGKASCAKLSCSTTSPRRWRSMQGVAPHGERGQSFMPETPLTRSCWPTSGTSAMWTTGDSLAQTRGDSGGALDPKLEGMLTDLRKAVSESKGLPPYVIFQDVSLDEMATHYPVNPDELLRPSLPRGLRKGAAEFGQPFTGALMRNSVQDEGIERDEALLVRSSGSKSSNKVTIIQLMDRKMGLDHIAAGIHGERSQVLDEIFEADRQRWNQGQLRSSSSRKASMKSAWKSCSNSSRSRKTRVSRAATGGVRRRVLGRKSSEAGSPNQVPVRSRALIGSGVSD